MPHLQANWLYALSDLIYSTWDVTKLEKWDASWCASHGYHRQNYILTMDRCLKYSKSFNNFLHRYFYPPSTIDLKAAENGQKPLRKCRKCCLISSMKLLSSRRRILSASSVVKTATVYNAQNKTVMEKKSAIFGQHSNDASLINDPSGSCETRLCITCNIRQMLDLLRSATCKNQLIPHLK